MLQPLASSRLSPARFVAHAAEVASFYGFSSRSALPALAGQPLLAFYTESSPAREAGEFALEIDGSPESMSEAFLIKTSLAILREWNGADARVRVNSPGDRDSRSRFERELSWHIRKHNDALCALCRGQAAKDPLVLYACSEAACRAVAAEGPHAINHLSERSRVHFKSLLEQLEGLGVPYELDDFLTSPQREARTLFIINLPEDGTVLAARGGRYEDAAATGGKKEAPTARASIFFRKRSTEKERAYAAPAAAKPRLYFVQLGDRARMRGLLVLDLLRTAHINVGQSFDAKALSPQLARARELGVSYLLIMGEREALDGTVIVRHALDSAQTTVPLSTLPRYLKTLHA